MAKSARKNSEKELELLEHLAELRTRLLRCLLYVTLGAIIAFFYFDPLYDFLLKPAMVVLHQLHTRMLMTSFLQGFTLTVQVSVVGGLVLAAPFVTAELWFFILPALNKQERKAVLFVGPLSVVLFALGVFLCYVGMPRAFAWFALYIPPGTTLQPEVGRTLIFTVQMYLAFGLMFEMPVLLMFLGAVGIVNSRMMLRLWREATVAIAFIAAVVTPSNDALTMMMMAVPMVGLYFLSIGLVKMVEK
ncbi:MAG: twin-arginine translocase subunit TatC [Armatimonadetes bacterium]|nr:twin-arginine translocase subunit TatC [Armatimonadota bacterium]